MGTQHQQQQRGFTVIETLLFLSVSAILAVALLGGWTAMINTQRYKDSSRSLQSYLQQQYNLVYNVENGRGNDLSCTEQPASVSIVDSNPLSSTERGQSSCVLMGRYIEIKNGMILNVSTIVGFDQEANKSDASYTPPASDIASIKEYKPTRSEIMLGESSSEFEIPWQAFVVGTGDSIPKNYAIAIIRAPQTGIVHTFAKLVTGDLPAPIELADTENEENDLNLCLDPGVALAGGRQGVVISKYASSQSAVKTIPETSNVCG